MDRTERFYRIDRLLRANAHVPIQRFLSELGVSRATFKRDLEYLRDRLDAPIFWDAEYRGYCYREKHTGHQLYLPGLWLSPSELAALLAIEHLIESIEPGVLSGALAPFRDRIGQLLENPHSSAEEIRARVKILPIAHRIASPAIFSTVADALLRRKRLLIAYAAHGSGAMSERKLSPQRLVNYRDNWYLDAWCHLRKALRTFSMDGIQTAVVSEQNARAVPEKTLDRLLGAGYGIFSGPVQGHARLRFSPTRARWVSREIWHPKQTAAYDAQGYYLLEFPYSDARELVLDILRHGKEVEVLGPDSLRETVAQALVDSLKIYAC